MSKNDVLFYLASHVSYLMVELAHKHEDGIFLSEILKENPHSYRSTRAILDGYCKLLNELSTIYSIYEGSADVNKMIEEWIVRLNNHRSKETKLFLDSVFVDIGGDH